MKKLLSVLLAICMLLSIGAIFTACDKNPDEGSTNYTVTKEEWKMNFNLTRGQAQAQTLSCKSIGQVQAKVRSNASSQITSYTIYAEGESEGITGTSLLKVAPNAMSIEFYVEEKLRVSESGTFESSTDFYKNLTANVMSYFPFADNYDDFSFDEEKNAYLSQNITSAMYDEYSGDKITDVYTKTAEVTFISGYLNTVTVDLCDNTFEDVYASFVFTFSNINNTTVEV